MNSKNIKIYNYNTTLTITDCGSNGKITNGSGDSCIYISAGKFNMYGGSITGNKAKNGGGVYVDGGEFNMYGGSITDNEAKNGGGVRVYKGTFNMRGGSITDNVAETSGGGVHTSGGYFYMYGGSIANNKANYAGGVYVGGGTFNMHNGSIDNNTAELNGGGVKVGGGTFEMHGGSITNNEVSNKTDGNGGGVYSNGGTFNMNDGSITDNEAKSDGGGVYVGSKTFSMSGGSITKNTAGRHGGGVYTISGTFNMSGGSITENSAQSLGGGVYFSSGLFNISGGLNISANKVGDSGKGNNVYLCDNRPLTIGGELTQSEPIEVYPASITNFTYGWKTHMSGKTPSNYFTSGYADYKYVVLAENGELTLSKDEQKPAEKPDATFTATGDSTGTLTNVANGMQYKINNGDYTAITDSSVKLTDLSAGTIYVQRKGNGTTTIDSEIQEITVTQAAKPTGLTGVGCTDLSDNDGKITGVSDSMEYQKQGDTAWTHCTGTEIKNLSGGTYFVRVKASGTALASASAQVEVAAPTPIYGISLDQSGTYNFPAADEGYTAPTALSVKVENTGNQPTGELSVSLSGANASSFTLSTETISSIAAGGTADFTVAPKTGLSAGTYSATVTVSGKNNINKSFSVSFTVNEAAPTPTYSISLDQSGTYNFPAATEGYTAPDALTVNVKNTGNRLTGELSVSLSGTKADSFTLSTTTISDIAVGKTADFTVAPQTGLSAGEYTATVTVSNSDHEISKSFEVKFYVLEYKISLDPSAGHIFPDAVVGYDEQEACTFTITNVGTQETGNLTVTLVGENPESFTVNPSEIGNIAVKNSGIFTIAPKTGLGVGTYSATVNIKRENSIIVIFGVKFTVKADTGSINTSASSGTVHDGIGSIGENAFCYDSDSDSMINRCVTYGEAAYYPIFDVNSEFVIDHRMVEGLKFKVKYTEGEDLVNGEPQLVKVRVDGEYCYFIKFDIKQQLITEIRDICGTLTLDKSKKGNVPGKDYRVKKLTIDFDFQVGCEYNYSDDTRLVVDSDLEIPLWPNEFFLLKYDCGEEVEFEFGSDANEGSFTVDVSGQGKNIIAFNTEIDENIQKFNPDAKIIAINFNDVRFNRTGVFCYEADDMKIAYAIQNGKLVKIGEFVNGEVEFRTNTLGRYIFADRELISPANISDAVFVRER